MSVQTFNLRNPYSGYFLATVRVRSRTGQAETAERIKRYIARRLHKGVSVHPM